MTEENLSNDWEFLINNSPELSTNISKNNKSKNRYSNHFAPDNTLVQLSNSNYINANHIYINNKEYIVTQAPIPQYIDDFWDTIWEKNIDGIVMLTDYVEKNKTKANEYLPSLNKFVVTGKYIVSCAFRKNIASDIVISTLKIMSFSENRIRILYHYFYKGWPDFGVPSLRPNIQKCKFNIFFKVDNLTFYDICSSIFRLEILK